MDRVILIEGPASLALVRDDKGAFISIENPSSGLAATFPVKVSLLKAVIEGYSYQVANEFGSLRFALVDAEIDTRFEGKGGTNLRSKLKNLEFSEALSKFNAGAI